MSEYTASFLIVTYVLLITPAMFIAREYVGKDWESAITAGLLWPLWFVLTLLRGIRKL